MALSWQESKILPFGDLADALAGINTVASTVSTTLGAVKAAVNLLPGTVDLAALAADAAISAVSSSLVSLIADGLDTGIYALVIYPQRIDYSRARLREMLGEKRTAAAAATQVYERARAEQATRARTTDLTAIRGATTYLEGLRIDAETKQAELAAMERADFFSGSDLAVEFPFGSFMDMLQASISDVADSSRPQFSASSVVSGGVFTISADTMQDLARSVNFLSTWFQHRGLAREKAMLDRISAVTAWNQRVSSDPTPPDWLRLSLAKALGLDGVTKALRDTAAALGRSNIIAGSTATAAVRSYVADAVAALDEAVVVQANLLAGINALAQLADAKVTALLVPPVDGEREVTLGGTLGGPTSRVPNLTAGVDGFMSAVRNAGNAPDGRWVVGVCLLVGVPAGVDVTTLTPEVASSAAVTGAVGTARGIYDTLSKAVSR